MQGDDAENGEWRLPGGRALSLRDRGGSVEAAFPAPQIERLATRSLSGSALAELRELCDLAYGHRVFETFGGGEHLLGRLGGRLVCHAMWIIRWLQPDGRGPLETAYVELVATHPDHRQRGYATAIMQRLAAEIADAELGALSPATHSLYERLGWCLWRGGAGHGPPVTPHAAVGS
jgi:GNAT superfamily N-acetyltransferase